MINKKTFYCIITFLGTVLAQSLNNLIIFENCDFNLPPISNLDSMITMSKSSSPLTTFKLKYLLH